MGLSAEEQRAVVAKAAALVVDLIGGTREQMLKQNFTEIEGIVEAELKKLGRLLLAQRLEADPRAEGEAFECTQCHGRLRIQEDRQRRSLETEFGVVEYRRPYGVCDRCGISYAPLDCGMGIPSTGGSVRRAERVCHAAVNARSFESAAEILREHDGMELSAKGVRVIAEAEGERLARARQAEVEGFRQGVSFPQAPRPALLVVTADGGRVQTRQSENGTAWKEDKIGSVYDAEPRKDLSAGTAEEYDGAHPKIKTYAASLAPWEEFGWMLCVEAWRRGYEWAKQKLFISDGAPVLRTLREMHFKEAVFILDWYHAVEHLAACARAAFGEGTDGCVRWYERMKEKLWFGEIDAILRAIEKESVRLGPSEANDTESHPRVVLSRNLGYFEQNRQGMDYPRFRIEGWPIGSGVAEGAVKQFGMRLKGSEKFWNGFGFGKGAEEMLALCALHRSEDRRWRAHWNQRALPYTREPKK